MLVASKLLLIWNCADVETIGFLWLPLFVLNGENKALSIEEIHEIQANSAVKNFCDFFRIKKQQDTNIFAIFYNLLYPFKDRWR